jgi:hypothetical protein
MQVKTEWWERDTPTGYLTAVTQNFLVNNKSEDKSDKDIVGELLKSYQALN